MGREFWLPEFASEYASDVDEARFMHAVESVLSSDGVKAGIGTLSEKILHKVIKKYVESDERFHEVEYMGCVADIKRDDEIFEVQTGSYSKLVPKLKKFLSENRVTVICPLLSDKTIKWVDTESGELKCSKSTKKENIYDAFKHLFGIRSLIGNPRLKIKILYLKADEYRRLDGYDNTRKRGAAKLEKIPVKIYKEITLSTAEEYASFIPQSVGETFFSKDFSRAVKRSPRYSYYVIKLLSSIGALSEVGKDKKAVIYKRNF